MMADDESIEVDFVVQEEQEEGNPQQELSSMMVFKQSEEVTETETTTLSEHWEEEEPQASDNANENFKREETAGLQVSWVESLQSPTIAAFSPSLDNNPLHGLGLQLATERAKELTHCGRRTTNLLFQVATLYEPYAQSLLKAAQTLQSILGQQQQPPGSSHLLSLHESLVSWSQETSKLAQTIQASVAKPLQAYWDTHQDTLQGLYQRYQQSRQACLQARQKALAAHKKYTKLLYEDMDKTVVGEPEEELVQNNPDTTATTTPLPSSSPKRFNKSNNKKLQRQQRHYQRYVERENQAVQLCQLLETMALESLQHMERDRALIVQHYYLQTLTSQTQALDEMCIALKEAHNGDTMISPETIVSKKKRKRLKKLLKKKTSSRDYYNYKDDDRSSGVMDADTLGLPEEVGKLRDDVRSQIGSRANRIQVVRVLVSVLESIASASSKLGFCLKQQLVKLVQKDASADGYSCNVIESMKEQYECPVALQIWESIVETLELESDGALNVAQSLRTMRTEKLDKVLLYGDKTVKAAAESDDLLWKQLCDAARAQTKAENRYRQSTAQTAKARERVRSVDSGTSETRGASGLQQQQQQQQPQQQQQQQQQVSKVKKHVNKSIANMFSILPDGGEQAMKILTPGARASLVKRSLEGADSKENKEKLLLDSAVEAFARAFDAYKSNAESVIAQYEQDNKSGSEDICSTIEALFAQVDSLRSSRSERLRQVSSTVAQDQLHEEKGASYIEKWTRKAIQEIKTRATTDSTEAEESSFEYGFMLSAEMQQSDTISSNEVLDVEGEQEEDEDEDVSMDELASDDGVESELNVSNEDTDATMKINNASRSMDELPCASDEGQPGNWLKRSLSAPISPQRSQKPPSPTNEQQSLGLGSKSSNSVEQETAGKPDLRTEIFLSYFWPDPVDRESAPPVIESFTCSFRDNSHRLPFQYGRVFITSTRVIFASWTGRKLNLQWADIMHLDPAKSFLNAGDDAIMITSKNEACTLLDGLSNRDQSLEIIEKIREEAKSANEAVEAEAVSQQGVGTVAPDGTLEQMEIILTRHLRNISIKRFYEIAWSEGNGTDEKPLYRPWLERGCLDVDVGDWVTEPAVGPWCGETYQQKRIVKFKIKRTTHLYIGPPVATVIQTQYVRVEDNDKCIFEMTVEFDGIPYSDAFTVEVRWVARREGTNNILVQVGVFVNFRKNTLLKSKIRQGTLQESAPSHKSLFDTIKAACIAAGGEEVEEPEEMEEVAITKAEKGAITFDKYVIGACGAMVLLVLLFRMFLSFRGAEPTVTAPSIDDIAEIGHRIDQLESEIQLVQSTLNEILTLLKSNHTE